LGFDLYLDFIGSRIVESSWAGNGIIDYYSETDPVIGKYCIYWTEVDQYNHVGFNFKPIKDLSVLVNEGYAIDFWCVGIFREQNLIYALSTQKTSDPDDHPWRMRMTIDETMASWNEEWNHLQIPLKNFTEHGSWDNGWFNPQGDFDWTAVEYFQIVAEHHHLKNIKFWLDNIRIVDPQVVKVQNEGRTRLTYELFRIIRIHLMQSHPSVIRYQHTIMWRSLSIIYRSEGAYAGE